MLGASFMGERRGLALVLLLAALLAFSSLALWPQAKAGAGGSDKEISAYLSPQTGACEEAEVSRPYYCPEAVTASDPQMENLQAELAESVPAELLPRSLLPESGDPGSEQGGREAGSVPEGGSVPGTADGDCEAAGAGGWTPLLQPYLPAANPSVYYWTGYNVLDSSGRMHALYGKGALTDIGQPPDAPGFTAECLYDHLYATFDEGAWNVPTDITGLTGLWDSEIVYFGADPDGYVHLVYSAWTWGRDASRPAGDWGAYQHEEENLWYRYLSPDGFWSAPRRLTGFSGSWEILGANFASRDGRLHGAFVARRNNETVPPSFRAQVGYLAGSLDGWGPAAQLSAWDTTTIPASCSPSSGPP